MRYFQIDNQIVFDLTGQDSQRYLNARLTQNIKALPVGGSALGAALTPQGKTQALFNVIRLEEQRFFLTADNGARGDVLTALKRYIVADRVNVTDCTDGYALYHVLPDTEEKVFTDFLKSGPLSGPFARAVDSGVITSRDRGFGAGYDLAIKKESEPGLLKLFESFRAHALSRSDIAYSRIVSRIPSYPEEINEETLFSEAQFKLAVSINKGCYVGQEVVERIESVGKTAKILQVVECEGCAPLRMDEEICKGGAKIGRILSSAWNPQKNKTLCFAQIKNDRSLAGAAVTIGDSTGTVIWEGGGGA